MPLMLNVDQVLVPCLFHWTWKPRSGRPPFTAKTSDTALHDTRMAELPGVAPAK